MLPPKHYEDLKIQPWEVIEKNGMGFFDGNVLKYIMRYPFKGGAEDLKKARHYLDKLIELNEIGDKNMELIDDILYKQLLKHDKRGNIG